jgi:hypothetical protein
LVDSISQAELAIELAPEADPRSIGPGYAYGFGKEEGKGEKRRRSSTRSSSVRPHLSLLAQTSSPENTLVTHFLQIV